MLRLACVSGVTLGDRWARNEWVCSHYSFKEVLVSELLEMRAGRAARATAKVAAEAPVTSAAGPTPASRSGGSA